jgi:zinc protease
MLLSALIALSLSAAPPKPFTEGPVVEGFSEYRLPNGLRVVLAADPSSPQVTVNLTVMVGSRHEDYGEKGMAHLFEHMLFKKTKKVPDIKKALTEMGGMANGSTWFDRTNYFEIFPASDATVKAAIDLESERLANAIISREQLATEMTVVRNELEMGENNPARVLSQRVESAAFMWHNYGKDTIGPRSDIETVPTERLQAFYAKYYQPDNAVLILSGKFDAQKALAAIADSFGKIPRPKRVLVPTYTVEPVQDGERSVTVRRVGGTPVLDVVYHVPSAADPDFAAIDVLSYVLGDAPSGRVYKALVETKKAARASCYAYQTREPGIMHCTAELTAKDAPAAAKDALLAELEGLAKKPLTQVEVERAKASMLKDYEMALNAPDRIGVMLSEFAALGDWRMFFIHRDRIKAITADDVNRVAQRYLKPSNRTFGEYVPTEKPDRAEVPGLVDLKPVLDAYQPAQGVAQGEAFEATPKNIEARTTRSALPNGFTLALLPKKTRGGTVQVAIKLDLGSLATLTGQGTAAGFAAGMLSRGTKTKTREQFKDALDQLKASLEFYPEPQGVNAVLEVRRPQLLAALDLIGEALKTPAFDAKEFEALRRETIARGEQAKDEPSAVGQTALRRLTAPYPKGHPYYVPSIDENIADAKDVKLEAAKDFQAKFYGAQAGHAAVVGDFDPKEVSDKLTALFGTWTAAQKYERIPRPFQAVAPQNATLELPDKANAYFGAFTPVKMKDSDADFPALMVADYLLGGGFLAGRVPQRLREKEGLSYGAGTALRVRPLDDSAVLVGYAIYAPQNATKIETGFKEEVERAVNGGFTDAEFKSGMQGLTQSRASQYADDQQIAGNLIEQTEVGRSFLYEADVDASLSKLSVSDVNAALKKYVDPKAFSFVKAGDFKKVVAPR